MSRQPSGVESRRRRHGAAIPGAALLWALAASAGLAQAACPPATEDGAAITRGDAVLAWRPVLAAGAAKGNRIPMARHFALEVQLCERGGISAAQLTKADATMPAHNHGMNYRPTIKPLGDGRFRVDGMMFHMSGQWRLAFEVQAGRETTRFTHDVEAD